MKARVAIIALVIALAGSAGAQVAMSPWGSFKRLPHGFVDRSKLNIHLVFPIFNRNTGSRAQVEGELVYDSDLWSNNGSAWQPLSGGGWHFEANVGGTITQWESGQIPCGSWGATYQESSYTYSFPDGTTGPVGSYLVVFGGGLHGGEGCPTPQDGSTTLAVQTKDRSYTVWTSAAGGVGIWDTQGDNELFDFQDRHYNSVTSSTSSGVTTYTDPLGTALTVDGNTNPISYSYTGSTGSMISVLETMETIPASANFGCYQQWSGNLTVPSKLQYPNGDTYTFGYDSQGRLASMVLPTGGTVYFPATESCSSGVVSKTLERWESVDGSGSAWLWSGNGTQTTETSPAGDNAVYSFGSGGVLAEVDQYQGASTELRATTIASSAPNGYIAAQTITTELLGSQPRYAVRQLGFDAYGNVTSSSATDWGTATGGGALLRSTSATWNVLGVSGGFADQNTVANTYGPQGVLESNTGWSYDSHGEVSTVSRWNSGRTLDTTYTYNGNGTVATVTDPSGAVTSYTYGACNGFFPTLIQSPVAAIKTTLSWNCNGPVLTQTTDGNGLSTTYGYTDAYGTWRLTSVQTPDGAETTFDRAAGWSDQAMVFNGNASTEAVVVTLDALGRPVLEQREQAPGSQSFDTVETQYDAEGRPYRVGQPYTGGLGVHATSYWTTTLYDALSRPVSVTDAGGGYSQFTYNQNDVLITRGPGDLKRTQEEMDGLGRLRSVCEITSASDGGSCGQSAPANGYLTSYARNGRGEITQVTQGAQTRSYSFDYLGRLTAETNPESGTTQYYYDTGYPCSGTSYGDLIRRVDANGSAACYSYDALHRATEISYTGPNAGPARYFVYDGATVDGLAMHAVVGRLAEAYTGSPSAKVTDLGFSYYPGASSDNEAVVYEATPHSAGWLLANEEHYVNGAAMDRFVTDGPAVTYSLDGEGRPYAASGGPALVNSVSYTPAGQPTSVAMSSGVSDNYYYDAATGRMSEYKFTVGGGVDDGALGWNSNGNGSLTSLTISDSIGGRRIPRPAATAATTWLA